MTKPIVDFTQLLVADRGQPATTIHVVDITSFEGWLALQPEPARALLKGQRFTGKTGEVAVLPGVGESWSAVAGVADRHVLTSWCLAPAAEALGAGTYRLSGANVGAGAFGWLMAHYRFGRYRDPSTAEELRVLLCDTPALIPGVIAEAGATTKVRDLVNTPAADMGPEALEAEAQALATTYNATFTITRGDQLAIDYPMIHAVGRAAGRDHAPRLIELEWGNPAHPRVAIIGKGVCFDSGGLDIKPSSGMRLMKKDMGGAAHALALAQLIMIARLPVRLHMLIPAVENAIGGNAFRPGDILFSRKGLSVEIANTDAEGRLVLADALTRAGEFDPALIMDFATLTGAARVALGPDLPALFSNDDALADAALAAGVAQGDPMWRLPLHAGYEEMTKSDIADMNNAPDGGFAGAITAALFLNAFVSDKTPWLHLDTFAWRPTSKPGRPKGGEALGLRAVWHMLKARFAG